MLKREGDGSISCCGMAKRPIWEEGGRELRENSDGGGKGNDCSRKREIKKKLHGRHEWKEKTRLKKKLHFRKSGG